MTTGRQVTIVTDSTSDLPPDFAAAADIRIVPLTVRFGDTSYQDGIEITSAEFLTRLQTAAEPPTTTPPSPAAFEHLFRAVLETGRDVVCVTLSRHLSETYESARIAAATVDRHRIRVIDSHTTAAQLGLIALEAAATAAHWAELPRVVRAVDLAMRHSRLYAVFDTLDYAARGGRVGRAGQFVGSALSIKPILTFDGGMLAPVERVRSWRKAVERLASLAHEQAPLAAAAVMHVGNSGDAETLASAIAPLIPARHVMLVEAGPVLAAYAGAGAVGVAVLRARGTHDRSATL